MDCQRGLLYTPNFSVLYSMTRSRSLCLRLRTKLRRRGSNSPQRSPRVATSGYCVVSGREAGERPWKRSSQIHSAPKMWASVSRTEGKLEPMGSSFPSVRDTLAHIFGAEWIWLERFQGRSPASLPDTTQYPDVATLGERWGEFEPRLLNFVRNLKQSDLDRVMEYKTLKFGVYSNPLWQSMQHLVNHGSYHRGQVTTLLRQLAAPAILTDLMHFYRERAVAAKA